MVYIKAKGNYVSLHTFDKRYLIHATMKSIKDKLDPEKFIRVHRSYFINIEKMGTIIGNKIIIDDKNGKQEIPIGRIYRNDLMNKINFMK